jgi:hypothetical protein
MAGTREALQMIGTRSVSLAPLRGDGPVGRRQFPESLPNGGIDILAAYIRQLLDRITGGKSMVDRPEE